MKKEKVYCIDCKHYEIPAASLPATCRVTPPLSMFKPVCRATHRITDTPIKRRKSWGDPYKLNRRNKCIYYEPKPEEESPREDEKAHAIAICVPAGC
jgi:hypothetical protein